MFKQHLSTVTGLDFYLILSLMIFFLFFIGVLFRLLFFSKKELDYLSNIPFDRESVNPNAK